MFSKKMEPEATEEENKTEIQDILFNEINRDEGFTFGQLRLELKKLFVETIRNPE